MDKESIRCDAARLVAEPTWTSSSYHDAGSCWELLRATAEMACDWQAMADKLAASLRERLNDVQTEFNAHRADVALAEYDKAKKGQ